MYQYSKFISQFAIYDLTSPFEPHFGVSYGTRDYRRTPEFEILWIIIQPSLIEPRKDIFLSTFMRINSRSRDKVTNFHVSAADQLKNRAIPMVIVDMGITE